MKISPVWAALGIVVAVACMLLAWGIAVRSPVRFGAVAVSESVGTWRLVFGYLMTVTGVVLGSGYRNLQARRQKGEEEIPGVVAFLRSVFLSIDFWLGVCGSPLVYALLLRTTEGGSVAGLTAIAIENGFFCTVVVGGLTPRSEAPGNGTSPTRNAS